MNLLGRLPKGSKKANEDAVQVKAALRGYRTQCQGADVFPALQHEASLESTVRRQDLLIRKKGVDARNVTSGSPHVFNDCAAFSADCSQIVFVARD